MDIITCQCGAKIRMPAQPTRRMRCPRCKQDLPTVATPHAQVSAGANGGTHHAPAAVNDAGEASGLSAGAPHAGKTCPVCQTTIDADEKVVICPACEQVHHGECWDQVGGCATYGCEQMHATNKPQEASTPLSAWGDTKLCPVCAERIKAIALRCRYCGTDFETVDPVTLGDIHRRSSRRTKDASLRQSVVALFVCSIIGLLAPITLIIALVWFLPKRRDIARSGPVYTVLGYVGLALSVLYSFLMLVFAIGEFV